MPGVLRALSLGKAYVLIHSSAIQESSKPHEILAVARPGPMQPCPRSWTVVSESQGTWLPFSEATPHFTPPKEHFLKGLMQPCSIDMTWLLSQFYID